MILILTDKDEPTTDLVIDWLNCLKKGFIRLSSEDKIEISSIYEKKSGFEAIFTVNNNTVIDTKNISSYWYRRSVLGWGYDEICSSNKEIEETVNSFLLTEYSSSIKLLNNILNNKERINKFDDNSILKLDVLQKAKKCGIKVPSTLICTNKAELISFYDKHNGNIITKPIGDPTSFFNKNCHQFTTKINLNNIPITFGISLFQEMVDKVIELRIFFLKGIFYGSAVFSQLNNDTKVDLKNYNLKKPARVVPYNLPNKIKKKLNLLMETLDLNSGSIDMILTPKLEYVFLEVNPIGQFEQVAMPCNYNLFKIMAQTL